MKLLVFAIVGAILFDIVVMTSEMKFINELALSKEEKERRLAKAKLRIVEINKKATTWKAELTPFSLLDEADLRFYRMDSRRGAKDDGSPPGDPEAYNKDGTGNSEGMPGTCRPMPSSKKTNDGNAKKASIVHQSGGLGAYTIWPKPLSEETELEYFGQVDPFTYKAISKVEKCRSFDLLAKPACEPMSCTDFRFDIRGMWPKCARLVSKIRLQRCNSCYAVAGAASFSDRLCIFAGSTVEFSPDDVMACARAGGADACAGGWASKVWQYFNRVGAASEAVYKRVGCKPCNERVKTHDWHTLRLNMGWEEVMKEEIRTYGSVTADMIAYNDFIDDYAGGIYQHESQPDAIGGGHIVRIIGYGHVNCSEGNVIKKYWLVANSWGSSWGERGFFRIRRGANEVGIESRDISFGHFSTHTVNRHCFEL